MAVQTSRHTCPYCHAAPIETVATAPYVRGYILAYSIGYKSYIGCVSCVRKKVLGEAGLSALVGWFSISALIVNPFLISYNLIQSAFVREKPEKVRAKLRELGIPETPDHNDNLDLTQIGYSLAAAMVLADGKVDEAELRVAEEIGDKVFQGKFDEAAFRLVVNGHKEIPAIKDLATLLKDLLNEDGKQLVFRYLLAIASADGMVSPEEKALLHEVAVNMQVDMERFNKEMS
ncbi:MAG: TerB family tellurite resistance protein, partial [Bacteroidota bacterium]